MNLGKRQIETLREFERGPLKFKETQKGEPWAVMKPLIERGLMWAEKRELEYWYLGKWSLSRTEWHAGLTGDGIMALRDIEP